MRYNHNRVRVHQLREALLPSIAGATILLTALPEGCAHLFLVR